jgi:hypothetical protein
MNKLNKIRTNGSVHKTARLSQTRKLISLSSILFISSICIGQNLTQTVRGTIVDTDNKLPLIGAVVVILGTNPIIGTSADVSGTFRFENVPTGRIALQLSYLGYERKTISNVLVNSGKEVVLDLSMEESIIKIDEVIISAYENKGEALNDMAMISSRSISAEETNRYAGGFNDPSKILSNFAGVTNTQDGSNDIIIRGNSPKYVQWRLEGIQITNPNHFADQSAVGGAVSTLNNNLLATSDFHTGAFSAEYGDVLSGVYDVKLRAGNNEKFESVFGFGLLGTDLTFEGPFQKGYAGSFLVNYRYSTASIISDLGLIDVNGIPSFQDAAFKIVLPTKKFGNFSLFGLGGMSTIMLNDVKADLWETPGNRSMRADISEDFDKGAHLGNIGINHTFSINENSFIKSTLAYSNEGIEDKVYESKVIKLYDNNGEFMRDSSVSKSVNFRSNLKRSTYRAATTYNNKLNAKNKIQVGSRYTLLNYKFKQSQFLNTEADRFTLVNFDEQVSNIQNFINWKYRLNEAVTIVSGIHNMNVMLNNKSTVEARFAINWKLNSSNSFHLGYGGHSTMPSIHNYFAKVAQEGGSISEPNRDLDFLKAHHYVLGYEKRFSENMRVKAEVYYQSLYNLPVENNDTSYFATINEGLEFRYVDLVNKGTGQNYGLELTLERFFNNNYYYLINGSVFSSKYKSLDGIERNTQYNSNYLFNILCGKEFENLGKNKNRTLGLNAKVFLSGGKKIIPLLRDSEGDLAVDPENNSFWDYDKAYEDKIENLYQVTVSASYKWNKPKATHEIFLNLDNVTNNKGKINEFYDESEQGSVGYTKQFGLFPNLMYKVYF